MRKRLTPKELKEFRASKWAAQGHRCALTQQPITLDKAVVDHDHSTGVIRGVLHRGVNSMLGVLENNRKRYGLSNDLLFAKFLQYAYAYLMKIPPADSPIYPTHRTPEERKVLVAKRAKARRKVLAK